MTTNSLPATLIAATVASVVFMITAARRIYLRGKETRSKEIAFALRGGHYGDSIPALDESVIWDEEELTVIRLISALPDRQRDVMALYLAGFTQNEIQKELGMRAATVRSNLRHARISLRQNLRPEGGGQ